MTESGGAASTGPGTDLHRALTSTPRTDEAVHAADAAARAADVHVRGVSELAELDAVYRLYTAIWRPDPKNPPVTSELLRALTKSGNYVVGAFDDDELIGACVGFFGAPADGALHSHIAGVSGAARGRSVGFALKVHQRAWAMLHGVSAISWTFDPLVRRNAYFNVAKLAGRPTEYLTNFYGGMHDAINGGDDTDRVLVDWQLDHAVVAAACAGTPSPGDAQAAAAGGAVVALDASERGHPLVGGLDATTLLVAIPPDIERLRVSDPGLGQAWRVALREVLGPLMTDGGCVTAFDRAGWYVLQRADPASTNTEEIR